MADPGALAAAPTPDLTSAAAMEFSPREGLRAGCVIALRGFVIKAVMGICAGSMRSAAWHKNGVFDVPVAGVFTGPAV